MKRRSIVHGAFAAFVALSLVPCASQAGLSKDIARGGSGFSGLDTRITGLLAKWNIPGGAVAVSRNGRLVYATGYGLADPETREPVRADSRFRMASISKPVTSAAILRLVEEGKLSLDDRAFHLLEHLLPEDGVVADRRIFNVTIRQLLQHTGGWDLYQSFDPMFVSQQAADAVGAPAPASSDTVIRYMLGQPLQTAPGTAHQYSNFGYNVLGRVIEAVSGQTYEAYVQEHVLAPAGVTCMQVGRSLLRDRAIDEVRYVDAPGAPLVPSVFPAVPGPVRAPYGGWHLEAMDANGGWIGSAVDVVRFVTAVDGSSSRPDLLRPPTIQTMVARPSPPLSGAGQTYYAMGWGVVVLAGGLDWQHGGALNGTTGLVIRRRDGIVVAALFNSWARTRQDELFGELGLALYEAINEVNDWPDGDLFPTFPACSTAPAAFNLAVSPASVVVSPGQPAEFTVDAATFNGFGATIDLSASVEPAEADVTVSLSEESLSPGGRATVTVRAGEGATTGEYRVTVAGSTPGTTRSVAPRLLVAKGPWIHSAEFDGRKRLTLTGIRFGDGTRVFVNGVDRSARVRATSNVSIALNGKPKKLGLTNGANVVVVVAASGETSNSIVVRL